MFENLFDNEELENEQEEQVEETAQEKEESSGGGEKKVKGENFRASFFKEKKMREKLEGENAKYKKAMEELGYEGDLEEFLINQKAERTGLTREEIIKEREELKDAVRKEAKEELEAEYQKKREMEKTFAKDISAIKAKYPDAPIESIEDLGMEFVSIMVAGKGKIDATTAYELLNPKREKEKSMGSTKGKINIEKDFFTVDEVNAMSASEIKKNFDKIEKSRKAWR